MFGRTKKMAVLLNDLLAEISRSVCNANYIMENISLEQYITQGYQKTKTDELDTEDSYLPLTFNLSLQDQERKEKVQKVPVSALVHNNTMHLEQVDVTLKFKMYEQEGNIMVDCMPHGSAGETLDEMTLRFKNSDSPEGIAKLTENFRKKI